MAVLASLNSSELVEPVENAITTIAASWSDCIEQIASICTNEKSSMHALTASFNILGENKLIYDCPIVVFNTNDLNEYKFTGTIGNPCFVRQMSTVDLIRAFKIGLFKPQTNYDETSFHDMQYATLIFVTKFLRKWTVHKPSWRGLTQ